MVHTTFEPECEVMVPLKYLTIYLSGTTTNTGTSNIFTYRMKTV